MGKTKTQLWLRSYWVAGSDTLKFWMNKDFMEVNSMKKSVGAKVFVNSDNRTVVPLRFITNKNPRKPIT
ncbi:stalk domain-containing protein [Paenibacillus algorifonticola]|uniref:stalk domain-containing protein n=1 Tax=Paenibacillus algorifonticola TaxID=684063 RepID=UPI00116059BD|nr:stalk domain-containing protein [Paenibacillus algorifonticola]